MKTMVEAMVHSLNSLAEVEIVEHKDNNHCLACALPEKTDKKLRQKTE